MKKTFCVHAFFLLQFQFNKKERKKKEKKMNTNNLGFIPSFIPFFQTFSFFALLTNRKLFSIRIVNVKKERKSSFIEERRERWWKFLKKEKEKQKERVEERERKHNFCRMF